MSDSVIQMKNIERKFGCVIALASVSVDVFAGEPYCLLGDIGAGKSTFYKAMSGVHKSTAGNIIFVGQLLDFADPRDAISARAATLHQHLAMILLMLVSRNFFMDNVPVRKIGPIDLFDHNYANRVTM